MDPNVPVVFPRNNAPADRPNRNTAARPTPQAGNVQPYPSELLRMDPNVPVIIPRNDRPATRPNRGNDGARRHGEAGNVAAANPARMPSQQVLTDALGMLSGTGLPDLAAVTGPNTVAVVNHVHNIGMLPTSQLHPSVLRAARQAHDNPEQLVRNLLALVTANPPVMPNRPGSTAQPANRPNQAGATANARPRMPSQDTLTDAVGMLTGTHDADLTAVTGRNTLNVINHLQDIATRPTSELASSVRRAARSAQDNPQQLVHNLLALATANPPVLSSRPGSVAQPAEADARPRMPSRETVMDAVDMLTGNHDADLTEVTGRNTLNVINHLHDIGTRSAASPLDPRVREAAQQAGNNPEQLVRNLLALATANPPVLSNRPGSSVQPTVADARPGMPSLETLTDTVGMLTGTHDADLTELTALNTQNVIDHLQDIVAPTRQYPLRPIVREAAQQAGDNPEQLVRNLLALVTADVPVRSNRPSSSLQPRLPSPEALTDAIGMLTGARDAGLTEVTGRNTLDVINHLHDIEARSQTARLNPIVREAAQQADNNPAQLVRNLLALVTANPPVLSNRPGSSVQPANAPVVADRPGSPVQTDRPNDAGAMADNRTRMPSTTVLTEAAEIVGAMQTQLANIPGLTDRHLSDVSALVRDIMSLPPSDLPPDVRRAAQRGHDSSARLVRNLLDLVATNRPVRTSRPGAAPQRPVRPDETGMTRHPSRIPSTEVMTAAVSILNAMHSAGISGLTSRNLSDVLAHVQDIMTSPSELRPSVLRAAQEGRDDPARLARNLLALVRANPPVLSRHGPSSQPPNRP
jgi:hypothetical protein